MKLSIILDENIAASVADFIRERKSEWTVKHVGDLGLKGASDHSIFEWAQQANSIIVTYDEDFADARMYPAGSHAGVIRLRVWPTTVENTRNALDRLFDTVGDEALSGSLVIVDGANIRIRRAARHG